MGIMGCATNPLSPFNYPASSSEDVQVSPGPNYPRDLKVVALDSLGWKGFTPTFLGMSLGDAQNRSRYRETLNSSVPLGLEGYADVYYIIRFGFTSTFSASNWETTLPGTLTPFDYTTAFSTKRPVIGQWMIKDASAGTFYEGRMFLGNAPSTTPVRFQIGDDATSQTLEIKQGTPITFAAGDSLVARIRLRIEP